MTDALFNEAQKQAVEYAGGPLLIVAGAGTGKTTVITQKIVHLIKNNLAKPEQILALTFTDRAAAEMLERVDAHLGLGYTDMQISTFHAFAERLLTHHGLAIGIPHAYKLLTETGAWLLMREHFDKFNLNYYRPLGNPHKHIHALINHFAKCKDELITPADYLAYAEGIRLDRDDLQKEEQDRLTEIANAYHTYEQLLLDNGALDFASLMSYAVKLLKERAGIRKALQDRYKYILVDEFQDVNWAQYQLVRLIAEANSQLTVVGDDDQSIYAFRGASVSNILRFNEDYPAAKSIVLTENYRSGQTILDHAYTLVQHNNPDRLEIKLKINKKLTAQAPIEHSEVTHIHRPSLSDEVAAVRDEIIRLKETTPESTWSQFAILVRANNHAQLFVEALEAAGIPHEFRASSGLFRQSIVLDCLNFFKAITDYHDATALYRLLRLPIFSTKENDLQRLTFMAKKKSISYYEAMKRASEWQLSVEGIAICEKIIALVHQGMQQMRSEKPTNVLYHFLDTSGYLSYLTQDEEKGNKASLQAIQHVTQWFAYIETYQQAVAGATVAGFMDYYRYVSAAGDDGELTSTTDSPDAVHIMTVHASKGLEFRYVFIVNLVEERFPSRPRGEPIELPLALIKEQLPEGDGHYEEERRLMYVAMTRAKERLYLTSADDYGGIRQKKISRFLGETGLTIPETIKTKKKAGVPVRVMMPQTADSVGVQKEHLPTTFSFSQVKAYETCPYQYKLAHILRIPTKSNASFSFGQSMHSTLQAFYERVKELNSAEQPSLFGSPTPRLSTEGVRVPLLEELFTLYDQHWIEDWYDSKRQREDYYKKGKEILKTFYTAQENNWSIPLALESWFKIAVGPYFLHGRIDRVDTLPDGTLEIIDYKTGQSKEKVVGDEKDQLLIYQIAVETLPEFHHVGKPSKLTFFYLNDQIRTSFLGNSDELALLKEKLHGTITAIREGIFPARPSQFTCSHCDFRDICDYRVS